MPQPASPVPIAFHVAALPWKKIPRLRLEFLAHSVPHRGKCVLLPGAVRSSWVALPLRPHVWPRSCIRSPISTPKAKQGKEFTPQVLKGLGERERVRSDSLGHALRCNGSFLGHRGASPLGSQGVKAGGRRGSWNPPPPGSFLPVAPSSWKAPSQGQKDGKRPPPNPASGPGLLPPSLMQFSGKEDMLLEQLPDLEDE